jgi:hypothetical protein
MRTAASWSSGLKTPRDSRRGRSSLLRPGNRIPRGLPGHSLDAVPSAADQHVGQHMTKSFAAATSSGLGLNSADTTEGQGEGGACWREGYA